MTFKNTPLLVCILTQPRTDAKTAFFKRTHTLKTLLWWNTELELLSMSVFERVNSPQSVRVEMIMSLTCCMEALHNFRRAIAFTTWSEFVWIFFFSPFLRLIEWVKSFFKVCIWGVVPSVPTLSQLFSFLISGDRIRLASFNGFQRLPEIFCVCVCSSSLNYQAQWQEMKIQWSISIKNLNVECNPGLKSNWNKQIKCFKPGLFPASGSSYF